jgi:pyruvate,water dikinase
VLPFRGKAGALGFLRSIGLKVPDWLELKEANLLASVPDQQLVREYRRACERRDHKALTAICPVVAAQFKLPDSARALLESSPAWAIRSDCTGEDSEDASFAGVFSTELEVTSAFTASVGRVWLSKISAGAVAYCESKGIDPASLTMSVILQPMVTGPSGALFQGDGCELVSCTLHSERDSRADHYLLRDGAIVSALFAGDRARLTSRQLDRLLGASVHIRRHCSVPLDIEYVLTGEELMFVQARRLRNFPRIDFAARPGQGIPAAPGYTEGAVVTDADNGASGGIFVGERLADPALLIGRGIQGIILEEGNLLSHCAVLAREARIPAIVLAQGALSQLPAGKKVWLDGDAGTFGLC